MKTRAARTLLSLVALLPWASALFLLYRLEAGGAWTLDHPLRPVASVLVIATGLTLSFLLHSLLTRRR
jgi:hypothetical protein